MPASIQQFEGKPFTIKVNGRQRTVGEIVGFYMDDDRRGAYVTIEITDEVAAGVLGAAHDKAQAAASPIGLSEAEIDAAIADSREDLGADPGPFVGTKTGRMSCAQPNLSSVAL